MFDTQKLLMSGPKNLELLLKVKSCYLDHWLAHRLLSILCFFSNKEGICSVTTEPHLMRELTLESDELHAFLKKLFDEDWLQDMDLQRWIFYVNVPKIESTHREYRAKFRGLV